MRHIAFFAIAALFAVPRPLAAQDEPRFGIVMGFPAQVGVLWNVASRLAVRPEINWSKSATESTTTSAPIVVNGTVIVPGSSTTTRSDNWQIGVGVSALVYLSKGDALRTYVSPRFVYSRTSDTYDLGLPDVGLPPTLVPRGPVTTVITSYAASGSFGAQYALAKRFGLFGELGLNYSHTGNRNSTPPLTPLSFDTNASNWTIGLRSGVGGIVFFGK